MKETKRRAPLRQPLVASIVAALAITAMVVEAEADDLPKNEGQMTGMSNSSDDANGSATGAASNSMVISGEVVDGGVECPLFRTDDGREFTLADFHPHLLPVGTRMRLRGSIMQFSLCRQGISFRTVERLE